MADQPQPRYEGDALDLLSSVSAHDLEGMVAQYEREKRQKEEQALSAKDIEKRNRIALMSQRRDVTPEGVLRSIDRLRAVARQGAKEMEILRFPSELCTDSGRAINNSEPDWPRTLVGVPAQLYEIWRDHLRPRGFHLKAEIVEFPGGKPGDVGMFLSW
ncbi:MAG: hypothetical protein M0006_02625 [Magnetospirillum sp.]|nr:hypothetical protein [Magnetospirillum sp.]